MAKSQTLGRGAWTGAVVGMAAAGAYGLLFGLGVVVTAGPAGLADRLSLLLVIGLFTATVGVLTGLLLGALVGLVIGALATRDIAGLPGAAVLVTIAGWLGFTALSNWAGCPVWSFLSADGLGVGPLAVGIAAAVLHAVRLRSWRRDGADPAAPLCLVGNGPAGTRSSS